MDRATMGFDGIILFIMGQTKHLMNLKTRLIFFSENKNIAEQFGKSKEYLLKRDNQFIINQGNLTKEQQLLF